MLKNVTFWLWNCDMLDKFDLEIWSWKISKSQERYQIWVKTVFNNSFIYQVNFQNKLRLQRNISNFILNFPSKLERKSCRRWHEKVAMKPQRLSVWSLRFPEPRFSHLKNMETNKCLAELCWDSQIACVKCLMQKRSLINDSLSIYVLQTEDRNRKRHSFARFGSI